MNIAKYLNSRFELRSVLGYGGMGIVYEGFDTQTQSLCAIKTMDEIHQREASSVIRFRQEYDAMQRVAHPNIVKAIFADWDSPAPYFVMERVYGRNLYEYFDVEGELQERSMGAHRPEPPSTNILKHALDSSRIQTLFSVARDLVNALHSIHGANLIHRDLKPDNIWVDQNGSGKLLDFGVVKDLNQSASITGQVNLVGTYRYLSPEQAEHHPLSAASDIYALGLVLYELVSMRFPFYAESPFGFAYQHARVSPIPIDEWVPNLPIDLSGLIMSMLAKNPAARPKSAANLLAQMEHYAHRALEETTKPLSVPSEGATYQGDTLEGNARGVRPVNTLDETFAKVINDDITHSMLNNSSATLVVSGRPQSGRTRVVRDWTSQHWPFPTLSVQTHEKHRYPLQSILPLLDRIARYGGRDSKELAHAELERIHEGADKSRTRLLERESYDGLLSELSFRLAHCMRVFYREEQALLVVDALEKVDPLSFQIFMQWLQTQKREFPLLCVLENDLAAAAQHSHIVHTPTLRSQHIRSVLSEKLGIHKGDAPTKFIDGLLHASGGALGNINRAIDQALTSKVFSLDDGGSLKVNISDAAEREPILWWQRKLDPYNPQSLATLQQIPIHNTFSQQAQQQGRLSIASLLSFLPGPFCADIILQAMDSLRIENPTIEFASLLSERVIEEIPNTNYYQRTKVFSTSLGQANTESRTRSSTGTRGLLTQILQSKHVRTQVPPGQLLDSLHQGPNQPQQTLARAKEALEHAFWLFGCGMLIDARKHLRETKSLLHKQNIREAYTPPFTQIKTLELLLRFSEMAISQAFVFSQVDCKEERDIEESTHRGAKGIQDVQENVSRDDPRVGRQPQGSSDATHTFLMGRIATQLGEHIKARKLYDESLELMAHEQRDKYSAMLRARMAESLMGGGEKNAALALIRKLSKQRRKSPDGLIRNLESRYELNFSDVLTKPNLRPRLTQLEHERDREALLLHIRKLVVRGDFKVLIDLNEEIQNYDLNAYFPILAMRIEVLMSFAHAFSAEQKSPLVEFIATVSKIRKLFLRAGNIEAALEATFVHSLLLCREGTNPNEHAHIAKLRHLSEAGNSLFYKEVAGELHLALENSLPKKKEVSQGGHEEFRSASHVASKLAFTLPKYLRELRVASNANPKKEQRLKNEIASRGWMLPLLIAHTIQRNAEHVGTGDFPDTAR